MNFRKTIKNHFSESLKVKKLVLKHCLPEIEQVAKMFIDTYWKTGGTVYLMGNGGSSCDAQHFAEELISAFKTRKRWGLAARAISDSGAIITAIGNDFGFENIFSRQLEGMVTPKDLVVAISTSGNSENIIRGIKLAKERGVRVVGFTGKSGGKMASLVDVAIKIPSDSTAHIQECHITIVHAICEIFEDLFFNDKEE